MSTFAEYQRQRDLAAYRKTIKQWGVFQHSSGPQGGYVVRSVDENGRATDLKNYGSQTPLKVFKRESAAQRFADKLNREGKPYA